MLQSMQFLATVTSLILPSRSVLDSDGKFLSIDENQNHGPCREEERATRVLRDLGLQDLRILASHLKGPEKGDLMEISLMQECFNFHSLDLPPQSYTLWTAILYFKDLHKRANLKAGCVQCDKSSQL
jgi:hypothetical protein